MQDFASGITWDLSDLYQSMSDPAIEQDLQKAEDLAIKFSEKYKPLFDKPAELKAADIHTVIESLIEISTLLTRIGVYANLLFSGNTLDASIGSFMQKMQVKLTDISTHTLFFSVTWRKLDDSITEPLIEDQQLSKYRHFLKNLRNYTPHTLGEEAEKVLAVKSNTGRNAFSRLFDETMNRIVFTLETDGRKKTISESEVLGLFHSPKRELRIAASASLARGLGEHDHVLTYIFNTLLADHRTSMKLRGFKHPMDSRNLANETSLDSILNLVKSVKAAYPTAQRYYQLKRSLLGVDKMYDHDRYAPVFSEEGGIDFKQCREIVLEGYYGFSEEAGKITEDFFEKNWIDAEVRPGKRSGAFCCSSLPSLHPYVLVNYTGTVRDVMTVAHELGHGLHQTLAGKGAGILEMQSPLTMAETASTFGELLVFEKILEKEKDPAKRMGLLCGKIDDYFATVFRQICMTDFELLAHEGGIKEGELTSQQLCDYWIKANADFYGDSVSLTENYRRGWQYIPHFVHTPFYCYAYSYAQLFVLALYQLYKKDKTGFIPKYFEILSSGGSKTPLELGAIAALDLNDPGFWQLGLGLLDGLVTQAEESSKSLTS